MDRLISIVSLAVAITLAAVQVIKHVRESQDEDNQKAAALIMAPADRAETLVNTATRAVEMLEKQLERAHEERRSLYVEIEDLKMRMRDKDIRIRELERRLESLDPGGAGRYPAEHAD